MKKVRYGADWPIYELGEIRHPSVVPNLESILKENPTGETGRVVLTVLAKLRVKNYYQKLLDKCARDLRKRDYWSNNGDKAFQSLGYIGGNEAIRLLFKYLFDETIPPKITDDHLILPNFFLATQALHQAIPDGPVENHNIYLLEDTKKWREWWPKNKDKYQGVESQADRDRHDLWLWTGHILRNSIFTLDEGDNKKQFEEIVQQKDPEVIELLEHRIYVSPHNPALILLARMRVKDYYEQYLTLCEKEPIHLDSSTEGRFQGLEYVGGNRAIRLVAGSLFDDSPGIKESKISPIRYSAARALHNLTPPDLRPTQTLDSEEDIQKWRDWWVQNKDRYK